MSERCNKDCRAYDLAVDAIEELIDITNQADVTRWIDKYNEVLCLVVSRDLPAVCHKDKNILYHLGKPDRHNHMALKHLPLQAYIMAYLCKVLLQFNKPVKQPVAAPAAPKQEKAVVSSDSIAENPAEMCGMIESITVKGITRPVKCALKKVGQFCAIHEYEELEKRRTALLSDVVKLTSPPPSPSVSPMPKPAPTPAATIPAAEFQRQRKRGGKKIAKFGKKTPIAPPAATPTPPAEQPPAGDAAWQSILLPQSNWGDSA